jgi:hypothetical protein
VFFFVGRIYRRFIPINLRGRLVRYRDANNTVGSLSIASLSGAACANYDAAGPTMPTGEYSGTVTVSGALNDAAIRQHR